jgi:hypothetical protein
MSARALWDKAKLKGSKTKIQAENVLLKREIAGREKQFGVELYDVLEEGDTPLTGLIKTPELFSALESQLRQPYEAARADMSKLKTEKDQRETEIVTTKAQKERELPATTAGDYLTKAGGWMQSTGTETGHMAKIQLIDHKMKTRKETFGVTVFEFLVAEEGERESVKSKMNHLFSNLSTKEKKIADCIDLAKKDVDAIKRTIRANEREIEKMEMQMRKS